METTDGLEATLNMLGACYSNAFTAWRGKVFHEWHANATEATL